MKSRLNMTIDAPAAVVFDAVANIENLPNTVEEIEKTEILSETKRGVGTRFRETRRNKGKAIVTELEVTEYEQDRRVRMVAESHGTVWDTIFVVEPDGDKSELRIVMDARAERIFVRIMNRLVMGMVAKSVERHLAQVKRWCEQRAAESS